MRSNTVSLGYRTITIPTVSSPFFLLGGVFATWKHMHMATPFFRPSWLLPSLKGNQMLEVPVVCCSSCFQWPELIVCCRIVHELMIFWGPWLIILQVFNQLQAMRNGKASLSGVIALQLDVSCGLVPPRTVISRSNATAVASSLVSLSQAIIFLFLLLNYHG